MPTEISAKIGCCENYFRNSRALFSAVSCKLQVVQRTNGMLSFSVALEVGT